MATRRRKSRKSCKYGKLKRKSGRRRCRKSRRKSKKCKYGKLKRKTKRRRCKKKRKSRKHKIGNCPDDLIEDIPNCGVYTPCRDKNGICRTRRGRRLQEVLNLQELAARRVYGLTPPNQPGKPVYSFSWDDIPPHISRHMSGRIKDVLKERGNVNEELGLLLIQALKDRNRQEAMSLIRRGANVNVTSPDTGNPQNLHFEPVWNETALMIAIRPGYSDIVRILINEGADVNARDSENSTALIRAVDYDHVDIARMLLEAGADVHARNDNGDNALWSNRSDEQSEEMEALILSYARPGLGGARIPYEVLDYGRLFPSGSQPAATGLNRVSSGLSQRSGFEGQGEGIDDDDDSDEWVWN